MNLILTLSNKNAPSVSCLPSLLEKAYFVEEGKETKYSERNPQTRPPFPPRPFLALAAIARAATWSLRCEIGKNIAGVVRVATRKLRNEITGMGWTREREGEGERSRERCGGHATKGCITWLSRGWETEVKEDRDARGQSAGRGRRGGAEGIKKKVGKTAGRKLREGNCGGSVR